jgi:spore coat protein H
MPKRNNALHLIAAGFSVLLSCSNLFAAAAEKAKKPVPGADIFEKDVVLAIEISLSDEELKQLNRDNRKYARATVKEGSTTWSNVGIHLKGAAGSFRGFDDKPALTLHFSKFTPDQKFHGLKKIHLNNSVQDGSYMTENICGELYRRAGVPAARASYATLTLNGRKRGLYVLKEGFEKEMLGLYFKKTKGNLYDGGFLREVTDQLERDQGEGDDVDNCADLKALAKAAQEQDAAKRFAALKQALDMDRFMSFAALQVITWDWDGYLMNRNNYRVFHDMDSEKMVFIPHGMDQMFWQADGPIRPGMGGLVANATINTPEGSALYQQRFEEIYTNIFKLNWLTNRVAQLGMLVRAALTNAHGANAGRDYDGQAQRMRELIVARHASIAKQLASRPRPLGFQNGVARLTGWDIPQGIAEEGNAKRDKKVVDNKNTLHIAASSPSSASWRTKVLLDPGRYRLEAMAKTSGVAGVNSGNKGEGAGIRISGSQTPRTNKLVGDSGWQKLEYEFDGFAGAEIVLVCELRASKGEAWFDADSIKLVKIK